VLEGSCRPKVTLIPNGDGEMKRKEITTMIKEAKDGGHERVFALSPRLADPCGRTPATNDFTRPTTSAEEPVVYNEETSWFLHGDSEQSSLHQYNRAMEQLVDLGWSIAQLIERTLDFLEVELGPDLIEEVEDLRGKHRVEDLKEADEQEHKAELAVQDALATTRVLAEAAAGKKNERGNGA
jgi:hypothetical protein